MGAFASGIAHEVGNPLAAVIGYVEILGRGQRSETERAELLSRSQGELLRIDRCLRDLLEFARPRQVALVAVDVVAIVTDALRCFEDQPRAANVQIVRDFPAAEALGGATMLRAMAEAERLREVVVNIISNGLDALAGVAGEPRLTVRVAQGGAGRVMVEVSDNGPGIPAEIRPRIFEPFFSTKAPGKGTGLGLAIVKASVAAWGGRVEVDEAPSGGARVCVFLNAVTGEAANRAVR